MFLGQRLGPSRATTFASVAFSLPIAVGFVRALATRLDGPIRSGIYPPH